MFRLLDLVYSIRHDQDSRTTKFHIPRSCSRYRTLSLVSMLAFGILIASLISTQTIRSDVLPIGNELR